MNEISPKQQRAVRLFLAGHSSRYVAKVIKEPYSQVVRFRNGLDLPGYDKAADPSLGWLHRWSGLQMKPLRRAHRQTTIRKMTPHFHVPRCQFPLWAHDAEPDQSFCGAYTEEGSSYCAHHHAICYVTGSGHKAKPLAIGR